MKKTKQNTSVSTSPRSCRGWNSEECARAGGRHFRKLPVPAWGDHRWRDTCCRRRWRGLVVSCRFCHASRVKKQKYERVAVQFNSRDEISLVYCFSVLFCRYFVLGMSLSPLYLSREIAPKSMPNWLFCWRNSWGHVKTSPWVRWCAARNGRQGNFVSKAFSVAWLPAWWWSGFHK